MSHLRRGRSFHGNATWQTECLWDEGKGRGARDRKTMNEERRGRVRVTVRGRASS